MNIGDFVKINRGFFSEWAYGNGLYKIQDINVRTLKLGISDSYYDRRFFLVVKDPLKVSRNQFLRILEILCYNYQKQLIDNYAAGFLCSDEIFVDMKDVEKYLEIANPESRQKCINILKIDNFKDGEAVFVQLGPDEEWHLRYYAKEGQVYVSQKTSGVTVRPSKIIKADPNNWPKRD